MIKPTRRRSYRHPAPHARGFSMVEIMVGLVIGILTILTVMQVYAVSLGHQRSTLSGGAAQQSGAIALYLLERDVRQSGYGIKSLPAPCLSPPVAVTGSAGINAIKVMYSNSAVGNVTGDACTTENTIHRRYALSGNGTSMALQVENLSIDGAVLSTERVGSDVVALTAETLPSAAAPTSLRVALAARSGLREKPDPATGACATTTSPLPTWPGGPKITPPNDGSDLADSWKCYRYKVYQTSIPLRDLVW